MRRIASLTVSIRRQRRSRRGDDFEDYVTLCCCEKVRLEKNHKVLEVCMESGKGTESATWVEEKEVKTVEKGLSAETYCARGSSDKSQEGTTREGGSVGPAKRETWEKTKTPVRRGRPSQAARLVRERTQSCGSILEFAKRKRGEPSPEGEEHAQKGKRKSDERDPRIKGDNTKQEKSTLTLAQNKELQSNRDGEMEDMWDGKSERDILIVLAKQIRDMKDMLTQENKEIRSEVQQLKEELRTERERNVLREKELEKKIEGKLKDFERKLLGSEQANKIKTIEARLSKIEEGNQKNIPGTSENTDELRKQVKEMEIMREKKDREERKNNIIIKGLNVGKGRNGLEKKVEEFVKERLGVEAKVERARLIGGGRVIQAKIKDQENKRRIMESKSRLGKEEIYIENDRTVKEREIQRKIVKMAKEQKAQEKEVVVRYWKLKIEDKWYRWNEAKARLELQTFFQSEDGGRGEEDGTRME